MGRGSSSLFPLINNVWLYVILTGLAYCKSRFTLFTFSHPYRMLCLHAMDTLFFCTIIKRWQLFESIPQLQIDVWYMSCIRRCKLNQTDVFALSGLIVQAFLSSVFLFILFNGSDLVLVNSSQYSSLFTLVYVSLSCVFIQSAVLVLASSKKRKMEKGGFSVGESLHFRFGTCIQSNFIYIGTHISHTPILSALTSLSVFLPGQS